MAIGGQKRCQLEAANDTYFNQVSNGSRRYCAVCAMKSRPKGMIC